MLYEDERFVRSNDGEIAERAMRIPDTTIAHCYDASALHQEKLFEKSTEHYELLVEMYEACDLLIPALPNRPILQDTVWRSFLLQQEASRIVFSSGVLPDEVTQRVRSLRRENLEEAFGPLGKRELVRRIFTQL